MKLTIVESPFAGDIAMNERYARACMADSLSRGEAPFASHLLYTQPGVLDDNVSAERQLGMRAGFAWGVHADVVAVYTDLGLSGGMLAGIHRAHARGANVEHRVIGTSWARDENARWQATHSFLPEEKLSEGELLLAAERTNRHLAENWATRRSSNPELCVSFRTELRSRELIITTSIADLSADFSEYLAEYYSSLAVELMSEELCEWSAGASSLSGNRGRA